MNRPAKTGQTKKINMSKDRVLYIELKKKLNDQGIKVKWWVDHHLTGISYTAAMAQLNGFNPMNEDVKKAIRSYLNGKTI